MNAFSFLLLFFLEKHISPDFKQPKITKLNFKIQEEEMRREGEPVQIYIMLSAGFDDLYNQGQFIMTGIHSPM
jgi:hypothetical protein